MGKRTGIERIEAIPAAEAEKAAFLAKVVAAKGDPDALSFLMAEAIDMQIAANGKELVGKDGRIMVTVEHIFAAHCMIAAAKAFRDASNQRRAAA